MPYDPQKHHRQSIRLKGYDYTQAGAYFVTMCAQKRELLFDPPPVREMIQRWWDELTNKFAGVETDAFVIMPNHIHGIVVLVGADLCVGPIDPRVGPIDPRVGPIDPRVDPVDPRVGPIDPRVGPVDPRVGPIDPEIGQSRGITPTNPRVDPMMGRTHDMGRTHRFAPTGAGDAVSLAEVVQWFKTMTTNEYIRGVKQLGWAPFAGKLWQRNYYEHIIRNEDDYNRIRAYILDNPRRWQEDQLHPSAPPIA